MRTCVAALILLVPQVVVAGGLRLAAELPDVPYVNAQKVSAHRFVKVNVTWKADGHGGQRMPHYELFDFETRKVVDVPVPLYALPKSHTDALGSKNPSAHLVHHDGQVTSFTFNARRGSEPTATYFCQYDHRTQQFSELVFLAPWDDTQHIEDIGFDPQDAYFYYAVGVHPDGNVSKQGFKYLDLVRINLQTRAIDWFMKVDLPRREKPLALVSGPKVFSPDGTKLALVEYNDRGIQRERAPNPQQQALVVDIPSKRVDSYPVPLTPYGVVFSRDNRYLIVGSNELGEIVRFDLQQKKLDTKTSGKKLVHAFLPTPSGQSFLVISNTQLASPKAVEVRRVSDLKLQTAIPVRMLFPGNDGVAGGYAIPGLQGRMLLTPYVDAKGWDTRKGVRLYEVPDDVDSPEVTGTAGGDVKRAQGIVLGKQYADAHDIRYEDLVEDPTSTFAKIAVTPAGEIFLTGIYSENSDYDYKPGRTRPTVVHLDANGKKRWERVLVKKGFLDHEDGWVAATPDGGCVVHIRSYVHPSHPTTHRLLKLDAKGKTIWEHQFRTDGGQKMPNGHRCELLPDGSVVVKAWIPSADPKKRGTWRTVISPSGKRVSEESSPWSPPAASRLDEGP